MSTQGTPGPDTDSAAESSNAAAAAAAAAAQGALQVEFERQRNLVKTIYTELEIKKTSLNAIDPALLDKDLPDEGSTAVMLNTYIVSKALDYRRDELVSPFGVLCNFKEDFEQWTEEHFEAADNGILSNLRQILRYRGVYTGPTRDKITKQLSVIVEGNLVLQEWDPIESERMRAFHPSVSSYYNKKAANGGQYEDPVKHKPLPPPPAPPRQTIERSVCRVVPTPGREVSAERENSWRGLSEIPHLHHRDQSRTPAPMKPVGTVVDLEDVPNEPVDERQITSFKKWWEPKDNYTGQPYDVLDTKVTQLIRMARELHLKQSQYHALVKFFLVGDARSYWIDHIADDATFKEIYTLLRHHFDTEINRRKYLDDWRLLTVGQMRDEHRGKTLPEVLNLLFNKLQLCQRALGTSHAGEMHLVDAIARACDGCSELDMAIWKPPKSYEKFVSSIRSAADHAHRKQGSRRTAQHIQESRMNVVDRGFRYNNGGTSLPPAGPLAGNSSKMTSNGSKRCWCCGKEGCWSTKHTPDERAQAKERFRRTQEMAGGKYGNKRYHAFLTEFEGTETSEDNNSSEESDTEQFHITQWLQDRAFLHQIDGKDPCHHDDQEPSSTYVTDGRYSKTRFQGIMPDSGAARHSTAGLPQLLALQRRDPSVRLNRSRAGETSVSFGPGKPMESVGVATVATPLGKIDFHVLEASTPFLMSLRDMDRLHVTFNNLRDVMIKHRAGKETVVLPTVRKYGHSWFFCDKEEIAAAYLSETQLLHLHKQYGHPAARRLYTMLQKAGHDDVRFEILEQINKVCHHCQVKGSTPQRFKFALVDDCEFNYEIIVDVFYIDSKPVLHVIDVATAFQAAKFLEKMSSTHVWDALCECWIYVYQGPPDVLTHDAGTNFRSMEFHGKARIMGITCHEVPVEAHNSIGKLERYHGPVRKAYQIIKAELKDTITPALALQMAVKAVNDTAGPDGLVPTLCVFGAYPRVVRDSPPSPTMSQRARAVSKAMKELREYKAQHDVRRALNTRTAPNIGAVLSGVLRPGAEVLIYREKERWTGPYKVIAVDGATVTVDTVNGPVNFRSTMVKPYNRHETPDVKIPSQDDGPLVFEYPEPTQARRRGRPSKAVQKAPLTTASENASAPPNMPTSGVPQGPNLRRSERHRQPRVQADENKQDTSVDGDSIQVFPMDGQAYDIYMTHKERSHYELSLKLRADGKITSDGAPFEMSDASEIAALIESGTLQPTKYDPETHEDYVSFGSRLVREIKGNNTPEPYEKSRLVAQGCNDRGKRMIMTQAPTVQRSSQRIVLALSPSIRAAGGKLSTRDITQAYTQSEKALQRRIFLRLPRELKEKYPEGTILVVNRPLYGLAEAGAYWFDTYQHHHQDRLHMETSTFDPCLMITKAMVPVTDFGIAALQTDDTLFLGMDGFLLREEEALKAAKFKAKPAQVLNNGDVTDFNGCRITVSEHCVSVMQRGQTENLATIDIPDLAKIDPTAPLSMEFTARYVEQRARGAYIASICQPEAAFDYSTAAQAQQPTAADVKQLNARIQWQIDNAARGLTYVPLDLSTAKLYVFVDGSFANNADLHSQIGYVILLANELSNDGMVFTIQGNIMHWSSTKCSRITRSVLASEVYGMVSGFDLGFVIMNTLNMIMDRLGKPVIPIVVCTDSYSLYECLVKLGSTTEKRLMIDIMALRQSYERREIADIRWINNHDNPSDAMTKHKPNAALERLVSTNKLTVRMEGWVEREGNT